MTISHQYTYTEQPEQDTNQDEEDDNHELWNYSYAKRQKLHAQTVWTTLNIPRSIYHLVYTQNPIPHRVSREGSEKLTRHHGEVYTQPRPIPVSPEHLIRLQNELTLLYFHLLISLPISLSSSSSLSSHHNQLDRDSQDESAGEASDTQQYQLFTHQQALIHYFNLSLTDCLDDNPDIPEGHFQILQNTYVTDSDPAHPVPLQLNLFTSPQPAPEGSENSNSSHHSERDYGDYSPIPPPSRFSVRGAQGYSSQHI